MYESAHVRDNFVLLLRQEGGWPEPAMALVGGINPQSKGMHEENTWIRKSAR